LFTSFVRKGLGLVMGVIFCFASFAFIHWGIL
jgi:hypothetical protein